MQVPSQLSKRCLPFILLALCGCLPCAASGNPDLSKPGHPLRVYRELIPLGSETFSYSNGKQHELFYVMASARSQAFEGQQVWQDGERAVLKTPGGLPVQNYPREVRFRVSVSQRDDVLLVDSPFLVQGHGRTFDELITSLKFEVRVFRALKCRIVHPTKVTHLGIPPDVPASQRIYEVTFDVGDVPISDRIVMHVLTDQGERLAKFNFDLY